MANYRRLFMPGGTYFFTASLKDRHKNLLVDHIAHFRASWQDVIQRHPFETLAAVVLPDHFHTVWKLPPGDHDFPTRLRLLKSGFTRRLPNAVKLAGRKGERQIWQRRYWEHLIRDEEDLEAHINYVHFNPVKHQLVAHMDNWPHSTWHRWKQEYGISKTMSYNPALLRYDA